MVSTRLFPTPDDFNRKACLHCAALFLIPPGQDPSASQLNGTLTLLTLGEKVFGVTAQHVVDVARAQGKRLATVRGLVKDFPLDSFWQPRAIVPGAEPPDLAITDLEPSLLTLLGKEAVPLERQPDGNPSHGVAVGFPTEIKFRVAAPGGYFIASTCVHVPAENSSPAGPFFTLFSELSTSPSISTLSGISGGPIFWTSEGDYGLFGITRSGPEVDPPLSGTGKGSFGGGPRLVVRGERITPSILNDWLNGKSSR